MHIIRRVDLNTDEVRIIPVMHYYIHIHYLAGMSVRYHIHQILSLSIACGADINITVGSLIRVAALCNNIIATDMLIQAGVDVNLCGPCYSAMRRAFQYASINVVTQLLAAGATDIPSCSEFLVYTVNIDRDDKIDLLQKLNYKN